MQIAFYMGFENVYLIGAGHNFQHKGNSNDEEVFQGSDVNHFDPNYFSGQKWNLADLDGSEIAYQYSKLYFNQHNRNIFGATVDGKLEVFEKNIFC